MAEHSLCLGYLVPSSPRGRYRSWRVDGIGLRDVSNPAANMNHVTRISPVWTIVVPETLPPGCCNFYWLRWNDRMDSNTYEPRFDYSTCTIVRVDWPEDGRDPVVRMNGGDVVSLAEAVSDGCQWAGPITWPVEE